MWLGVRCVELLLRGGMGGVGGSWGLKSGLFLLCSCGIVLYFLSYIRGL